VDIALEQAGFINRQNVQGNDWLFFVGMIGCFADLAALNSSGVYLYVAGVRSPWR
jgi:hypothetical protein